MSIDQIEQLAVARIPETLIGTSYLVKRKGYIMGVSDFSHKLTATEKQLREATDLINSLRTKLKQYGYQDDKITKKDLLKARAELVGNVICDYFGVTLEELQSPSRKHTLVWVRHLYVYFLRFYAKVKPSYVAEYVNKDRTVFYNSRDFVVNIIESKDFDGYKKEKADFENIQNFLNKEN